MHRCFRLSLIALALAWGLGSCSTSSSSGSSSPLRNFNFGGRPALSKLSAVYPASSAIRAPSFSGRPPAVLAQAKQPESADAVSSASPATDIEPEDPVAKACLECHGPFSELVKKSADYVNEWDEKVNPHVVVPHDSRTILACTECHEAHPLPATAGMQVTKANVQYCYSCHHRETFVSCKECHAEM